jgi:hypothetical protein
MVFRLAEAAEKRWRRLDGHNQWGKLILGAKFKRWARGGNQADQSLARNRRSPTDQAITKNRR